MKRKYESGYIIRKRRKAELSFLFAALRADLFYYPSKYYKNISKGCGVKLRKRILTPGLSKQLFFSEGSMLRNKQSATKVTRSFFSHGGCLLFLIGLNKTLIIALYIQDIMHMRRFNLNILVCIDIPNNNNTALQTS